VRVVENPRLDRSPRNAEIANVGGATKAMIIHSEKSFALTPVSKKTRPARANQSTMPAAMRLNLIVSPPLPNGKISRA